MFFRKKEKKKEDKLNLCDGISIGTPIYDIKENRIWTLVLKGIMVYFMSAGAVLGYLSSTGTKYNGVLINIVLMLSALYLSCIYYNKKSENIGNIIILILLLLFGMGGSLYINSGFYSVLNDLNVYAKNFFDFSGIRTYTEPIDNRYLAVNIAMIFMGIILNLLYNMWILKKMMYLDALLTGVLICMVPVYVQREPDLIYIIMLLTGSMLGFVFKRAGTIDKIDTDSKYKVEDKFDRKKIYNVGKNIKNIILRLRKKQDDNSRTNNKASRTTNKKTNTETIKVIDNVYDIKTYATIGIQLFAITIIIAMAMQVIIPKKSYYEDLDRDATRISSAKAKQMERVGNFWQSGLTGVLNKYQHTGGMSSGKLGGVSNVNLDYNTDFILTVAPYSYNSIYLRQYAYGDYEPYKNMWKGRTVYARREENSIIEDGKTYGAALKKAYESDYEYSAKAIIDIENVSLSSLYLTPYYTEQDMGQITGLYLKSTYEYYPKLEDNKTRIESKIDKNEWTRYSVANSKQLKKFCKSAGLKQGMSADIMVAKIAAYFQKNFPYTLNPGALGRGEDFVNDFLENKKKGYCAHFATTATLALRYMGVPARYVEGYAVSYENMLNNSLMDITKKFGEYYDGYSEIGETAVIDVEVSDASAHAWVEIYDDDYGWKHVEVTPSASEEERSEFWSRFMNIFRESGDESRETGEIGRQVQDNEDFFTSEIITIIIYIIAIVVAVVVLVIIIKNVVYRIRYYRASINDKIIMEYTRYLKKKKRKYVPLRGKMNYKEQIAWLINNSDINISEEDALEVINILDRAGFSRETLSKKELELLKEKIKM